MPFRDRTSNTKVKSGYLDIRDVQYTCTNEFRKDAKVRRAGAYRFDTIWSNKKTVYGSSQVVKVESNEVKSIVRLCLTKDKAKKFLRRKFSDRLLTSFSNRRFETGADVVLGASGVIVRPMLSLRLGDNIDDVSGQKIYVGGLRVHFVIPNPVSETSTETTVFVLQRKYSEDNTTPSTSISPDPLVYSGLFTGRQFFNVIKRPEYKIIGTVRLSAANHYRTCNVSATYPASYFLEDVIIHATPSTSANIWCGEILLAIYTSSTGGTFFYNFILDYICQ